MKRILMLGVVYATTLGGCKKESSFNEIVNSPMAEDKLYQEILNLGFSPNDIVDYGNYYLVKGEIKFFKKRSVKGFLNNPGAGYYSHKLHAR